MKYLLLSIALFASWQSHACNACGCAAQSPSVGLLAQTEGHFIGLQYTGRWYESHHDGVEAGKPPAHEFFQTAQLMGRVSIGKRWQVYAFVPWQYNQKTEAGVSNVMSGLGDISVIGNYMLFKNDIGCGIEQQLQVGGGFQAPTGSYDNNVLGSGDELAPSMQAGTGAWDLLGHLRYTVQKQKIGISLEGTYANTFANHQDYKYGNRLTALAQVFGRLNTKSLSFLPIGGLRYEQAAADYDNYTVRSIAQYTGGYMMFATAGLHVSKGNWRVMVNGYIPVTQHYGDGLVCAKGRMDLGIVRTFR
jgi:hypothetical protein